MKWCACDPADIVWVAFDAEHVAYHRPSGRTHFLNDASRALLTELLPSPQDFDTILEAFGAGVAEEDASAYRGGMEEMLSRLEYLGLVERV